MAFGYFNVQLFPFVAKSEFQSTIVLPKMDVLFQNIHREQLSIQFVNMLWNLYCLHMVWNICDGCVMLHDDEKKGTFIFCVMCYRLYFSGYVCNL